MKKEYINPTMEIVNIETAQMIAASPIGFGDDVETAEDAESRFNDIFDF